MRHTTSARLSCYCAGGPSRCWNDNYTLQAPLWADCGLVSFPLTSHFNATPLCPSCHGHFDCHLDPGFVFIPTDLGNLFNRKCRKKAAVRKPASSWYSIKHYLHRTRLSFYTVQSLLLVPKEWHGVLLTCLQRCFQRLFGITADLDGACLSGTQCWSCKT